MNQILEKYKFLGNARIKNAEYKADEDRLSVSLLVKNKIDEKQKAKIETFLKTHLDVNNIDLSISYGILDKRAILNVIESLFRTRFSSCYAFMKNVKIDLEGNQVPVINFKFVDGGKDILNSCGFREELVKELSANFFEEFSIKFEIVEYKLDVLKIEELKQQLVLKWEEDAPKIKFINTFGASPILGNLTVDKARRICDLTSESGEIVICGSIKFFSERVFKKLNKKTKQQEDKTYFTFKVYDGTENISCTLFCAKTYVKKIKKLTDGSKVVMRGNVDVYNDKLSFKPKEISLIESFKEIKIDEVKQVYKGESENYQIVKPKKYEEYVAVDFEYQEEKISNKLIGKTFVVFDIETTGLKQTSAEIVELAGVKVVDGVIVESWTSLIRPIKYEITPENEAIHKISPAMVAYSPIFKQVIPDFFKWAGSAILVGQNVQFDLGFLNYQAKECGYYFDGESIDTIDLAKVGLGGRLSNNKLSSICSALGIVNETAHRALSDAIATAKVLIKLGDYIEVPPTVL